MKKFLVAFSLLGLVISGNAYAGPAAGCGLSTLVIPDKSGTVFELVATFLNGISSNQTFGITSGTSGCDTGGFADKSIIEKKIFIANNADILETQMIQGNGEHISAFASVMGCKENPSSFIALTNKNYEIIFSDRDPSSIYDRTVGLVKDNNLTC